MNVPILIAVAVAAPVLIAAVIWARLKASAAAMKNDLQTQWGADLRLISGCGVIRGMNRVPGVLALVPGFLIYRAMITGDKREIPLASVASFTMEKTAESRHRRARKYWNAYVLDIEADAAPLPLFVIHRDVAADWKAALEEVFRR